MDRAACLAVAERCEREEPSPHLASAILVAAGHQTLFRGEKLGWEYRPNGQGVWLTMPRPDLSLDAAVSLVPKNSWRETCGPRRYLHIPSPVPNYWRTDITCWDISKEGDVCDGRAWAATEALSICAAALRARAAMEAA